MTNPTTAKDCLRDAMQAILRGDYAERDRLCKRAQALLAAEDHAAAIERVMAVDFYVTRRGTVIPVQRMAQAAGVVH